MRRRSSKVDLILPTVAFSRKENRGQTKLQHHPRSVKYKRARQKQILISSASTAILCLVLQQACSQQSASPGAAVPGVRLSITLTNSLMPSGSATLLKCRITNISANALVLARSPGPTNSGNDLFEVSLRSADGKVYVLTPSFNAGSRMADRVGRGEERDYVVPLRIPGETPPGRYKLTAKRSLVAPGAPELRSNVLDVQVK
jgi:hypothetical protein